MAESLSLAQNLLSTALCCAKLENMLKKTFSLIVFMCLLFALAYGSELGIDTLGGQTPLPSTYIGDAFAGCLINVALIPTYTPKWTVFWFFVLFIAPLYLYYFLPKLPNDVQNAESRHEAFNTVYE